MLTLKRYAHLLCTTLYCSLATSCLYGSWSPWSDCDVINHGYHGDCAALRTRIRRSETATQADHTACVDAGKRARCAHPPDCSYIQKYKSTPTGKHIIYIGSDPLKPLTVRCDLDTAGGGWTVFHRRFDGSQNFEKNWDKYKNGFGSVDGEHWLGLENIHNILKQGDYELRIDLTHTNGSTGYTVHRVFKLEDETSFYRLSVGNFSSGNIPDAFVIHSGMKFTTPDRDNDIRASLNCGVHHKAGWWFIRCGSAMLNSMPYRATGVTQTNRWAGWSDNTGLVRSTMMIRPRDL